MAKRKPFTMESNLGKITEKVQDKPNRVLNLIGQNLVKEIRPKTRKLEGHKGFLAGTTSYWARKDEKDLIIGYKDPMKIGYLKNTKAVQEGNMEWKYDDVDDPIKPTVVSNIDNIQKLIGEALDEIRKE